MQGTGLVHIYTGDGKGKTTAAMGLALRAYGAGLKVLVVQFLKGMDTSELKPLHVLGIPVGRSDTTKFIPDMTVEERESCKNTQQNNFERMYRSLDQFDCVVLDEVLGAIATHMVSEDAVEKLIREKPENTELVLTGRNAPEELVLLADYVSNIQSVKHPYNQGVTARKGIEF